MIYTNFMQQIPHDYTLLQAAGPKNAVLLSRVPMHNHTTKKPFLVKFKEFQNSALEERAWTSRSGRTFPVPSGLESGLTQC
jgi:hypothetical protein